MGVSYGIRVGDWDIVRQHLVQREKLHYCCVLDYLRDLPGPELLASVRAEVDALRAQACRRSHSVRYRPTASLTNTPSGLRRDVTPQDALHIIRMPDRVDMDIRDWIIPRRKVVVTLTTVCTHGYRRSWDTRCGHMSTRSISSGLEDSSSTQAEVPMALPNLEILRLLQHSPRKGWRAHSYLTEAGSGNARAGALPNARFY